MKLISFLVANKTNKYFKADRMTSTMENIPEFLPSDNEDSDEEDTDDHTTEGGVPTYVPRHLPAFPNKHSFRQTPVSLLIQLYHLSTVRIDD